MNDIEAECHRRVTLIIEGVCPRCFGPLTRESFPGHVEHGVCGPCDLGYTASVQGELWRWQESSLWWLPGH